MCHGPASQILRLGVHILFHSTSVSTASLGPNYTNLCFSHLIKFLLSCGWIALVLYNCRMVARWHFRHNRQSQITLNIMDDTSEDYLQLEIEKIPEIEKKKNETAVYLRIIRFYTKKCTHSEKFYIRLSEGSQVLYHCCL